MPIRTNGVTACGLLGQNRPAPRMLDVYNCKPPHYYTTGECPDCRILAISAVAKWLRVGDLRPCALQPLGLVLTRQGDFRLFRNTINGFSFRWLAFNLMSRISARIRVLLISALICSWSACFLHYSPAAMAQDAVWSSMYDVAAKAFEDEDYSRAEKLALETVEEAESLPKDGNQLAKTLTLLRKIYEAEKKQGEAEKVAARIESLGGYKEEPPKRAVRRTVSKTEEKTAAKVEDSTVNSDENVTAKAEDKVSAKTEEKISTKTESKASSKKEESVENSADLKTEDKTPAKTESESKDEPKTEVKSESKTESKSKTKVAAKSENKADTAASEKLADRSSDKSGDSKGIFRDEKSDPLQFEVSTKPDGKKAETPSKPAAKTEEPELNIERELRNSQVASNAVSQVKTEGNAQVYKLKEVMKLEGHMGWSKCVDISADATQALSGSADNTMRLWDLTTGKEIQKFEGHDEPVNSVAFSPSADRGLSGSSDKTVRLWDLEAGTEIRKFLGHANLVTCVAFAPIGSLIASGSYDGTVRIWDSQTGKEVNRLEGNLGTVKCLAFTPDADEIISGGTDKLLTLWNVKSGKKLRTFTGHSAEVATVAISDDGSRVVSAGRDTTVRTWDIDSGEELKSMTGHTNWVVKTRFISVDKVISGSLDKTFRIWDVDEGREERIFNLQHFGMWSLGFSELGDKAITGSDDFTLRVWQMKP